MLQTGTQGRLVPTGLTGWIAAFFVGAVNKTAYPPVSPVILITGTMDLAPYGIAGTIIPTPGHTAGSVSVVLGNGAVFSGDLLFPQIPSGEPGLPFWADNIPEIYTSVRALLDHNPQTFYPGHGGPFAAALARKLVE
jgi:glyoxylase-like metal-dependent hydrolase (beta-lactamase superfamily II)